jgi:lysophospholipase L1-like esterase
MPFERIAVVTIVLLVVSGRCFAEDAPGAQVELREGDRVVLLGGSLIEREQEFGYWETLLAVASSGKNVTFRNLGWSGDTVWGESRGMFEPQEGYARLIEQVQAANSTLVLVAYGNSEAFAGRERLQAFVDQYAKLLDDLQTPGRRFVLVSPLLMEAAQLPHNPDAPADHADVYNRTLDAYADAIAALARDRKHAWIDLRPRQGEHVSRGTFPLTDDGVHLSDAGYRQTARWVAEGLSASPAVTKFDFDSAAAIELRTAIVAKNELFFHRWRPQNYTYLFGFRTYEQGQNAAEVPQFDPLITAAEQQIAALARALKFSL